MENLSESECLAHAHTSTVYKGVCYVNSRPDNGIHPVLRDMCDHFPNGLLSNLQEDDIIDHVAYMVGLGGTP